MSYAIEWLLVLQTWYGGNVIAERLIYTTPYVTAEQCEQGGRAASAPPPAQVVDGLWEVYVITCKPIHVQVKLEIPK